MRVLGIETSCDETSAAIVEDGQTLGDKVVSQIDIHRNLGGVVPEIASRRHLEDIAPVVETALCQAGVSPSAIDVVAVTSGPGLIGSLLVGVSFAKALAFGWDRPLVAVNHLLGHVHAAGLLPLPPLVYPSLALVVSGGHTDFLWLTGPSPRQVEVLGRTLDDAAGEAFDKVARLMGLPYPGGPAIEELAKKGDPSACALPAVGRLRNRYDVSFSGLKTAVADLLRYSSPNPADLAAAFEVRVADELASRAVRAAEERRAREIVLCGGVAANTTLRTRIHEAAAAMGIPFRVPAPALCTDNGAMIAAAGEAAYTALGPSPLDLEPQPVVMPFRRPRPGGSPGYLERRRTEGEQK